MACALNINMHSAHQTRPLNVHKVQCSSAALVFSETNERLPCAARLPGSTQLLPECWAGSLAALTLWITSGLFRGTQPRSC